MEETDYIRYLRLPELLSLQHPLSPVREVRTRTSEHFFIIVHQASEIWLCQVLLDLRLAIDILDSDNGDDVDGLGAARRHLRRAVTGISMLTEHVAALEALPAEDFTAFRSRLGSASGVQSPQFRDLFRIMGLTQHSSPLLAAFLRTAALHGLTIDRLWGDRERGHVWHVQSLAEEMIELASATWRWQAAHLEVVTRLLGDTSGTGGTSGAEFLRSRLRLAFPELRAAYDRV
ncbi:tryptophan 2,3-dioxygenase family protein [Streptomyces sp. NPDC051909]|uniref:tryptophan 2,3-dioxygenase family protein n=1 Tax=Streptomyces sp. NPDC051909 TaxID=3154944 RepID=UPI0034412F29